MKVAVDFGVARLEEPGLASQFSGSTELMPLIGQLIKVIISFSGVIIFAYVLWAGWIWMTAAGDDKKVGQAKGIIRTAVVGLAILLLAYAITDFVFDTLNNAIGTASGAGGGG